MAFASTSSVCSWALAATASGSRPTPGRHVGVVAEDAVARARDSREVLAVVAVGEVVLAVAEEREVLVGQPLQERDATAELGGGHGGRRGLAQVADDVAHLQAHPLPVLDRLADVAQHALQLGRDRVHVLVVADPADLDVHPRLTLGAVGRWRRLVVRAGDGLEVAGDVTADVELRMDDEVDVTLLTGQLHDHRVDEERHVVGDDLHHRVATGRPAVLGQGRREDMDAGGPLRSHLGQAVVRDQRAVQLLGGAVHHVLDGDVAVVGVEEGGDVLLRRSSGAGAALGESDGLVQQVGLLGVRRQGGRH